MNSKMPFLLFILAFVGCQTNDRQVEDVLYQCLEQHYAENNIDLATSLDSLEDYLIAEDLLQTKDGQSKIIFYKQVVEDGKFPRVHETDLMKTLRTAYIPPESLLQCLKSKPTYDSLQYSKSTFVRKTQSIERDAVSQEATHVVLVSKAMLKHLTKNDFEHPFYRAQMLISFVMANQGDKAYIKDVPKKTQKLPSEDCFIIDISKPGSYSHNGESMEKEKIEKAFQDYLMSFDETTCVMLIADPNTLYSQFAEAQILINNCYHSYWNNISLHDYAEPFDNLELHQQEEIRAKYPKRIIEAVGH